MTTKDYRVETARALARQRAGVDANKMAQRAVAMRTPLSALSISDLADTLADVLQSRDRELIAHVSRMITLVEMTQRAEDKDRRIKNLYLRVGHLESVIRRLQKGAL